MNMTEKLLVVFGLGRSIYGRWHMRRLLSGLALTIGLTVLTFMFAGAVLIGGLIAVYHALLMRGWDPAETMLTVGGAAIVLTAIFAGLTRLSFRRLPHPTRWNPRTVTNEAINAFLDGFLLDEQI